MAIFNSHIGRQIVSSTKAGFLLCTDGNANLLINGNELQVSRGLLCLISPFLFIEIVSESEDCKWETIYDDKDIFQSTSIYIFYATPENNLFKKPCIQLDEKQIEEFMFFVDKIKAKQSIIDSKPKEDDSAMLRHNIILLEQAAGIEFISIYLQNRSCSPRDMTKIEIAVFNFFDLLLQNYTTHRDVEWYAKQANLSTAYFSQTIRQQIGFTPSLMIKQIVVANAKMLLAQPGLSIKEVAVKLNFANQFAFLKYFKSGTGMSPSEYRKREGMCC